MEITVGWWAAPLAITAVAYWLTDRWYKSEETTGDYSIGNALIAVISVGAWLIVSLIAWLIYALVT